MFFLHLAHVKILTGSFIGGGLLDVFFFRFNPIATSSLYGFSYSRFIIQELRMIIVYFTRVIVFFSFLWIIYKLFWQRFLFSPSKLPKFQDDILLLLLLPFGLTPILLFQNLAFIHDYMIYYLLPFVTLSTAVIFHSAAKDTATIGCFYINRINFRCGHRKVAISPGASY